MGLHGGLPLLALDRVEPKDRQGAHGAQRMHVRTALRVGRSAVATATGLLCFLARLRGV
jgi:hypothetical protein